MVSFTFEPSTKAIIHLLASTGIRPGAFDDPPLQMKHLEKIEDCYSLKIYDGSKESYFAFLIPECVEVLNQYFESRKLNGEKLGPESYIFHTYNTKTKLNEYLDGNGVRVIMKNLIKKAGIERNKANTKHYDKAVIYSLRKRFYTILKLNNDVNNNIAEKLLGHKRGLEGTYLTPTREESFKEFKKAIADLTINPAKRQAKEIELQQEKITELSKKEDKIKRLSEVVDEQGKRLDKIDKEAALDDEIHKITKEIIKIRDKISKNIDDEEAWEKSIELTENRDRLYEARLKLVYGE